MEKDTERDRLHQQLIKLGDMMADGLHYEDPSISREYRKVSKLLYPEMYPKKKRKPSQSLIRTLKECDCGQKGWTFKRYNNETVGIRCKSCGKTTGECVSNTDACKKWNALFK